MTFFLKSNGKTPSLPISILRKPKTKNTKLVNYQQGKKQQMEYQL